MRPHLKRSWPVFTQARAEGVWAAFTQPLVLEPWAAPARGPVGGGCAGGQLGTEGDRSEFHSSRFQSPEYVSVQWAVEDALTVLVGEFECQTHQTASEIVIFVLCQSFWKWLCFGVSSRGNRRVRSGPTPQKSQRPALSEVDKPQTGCIWLGRGGSRAYLEEVSRLWGQPGVVHIEG